ncbi:heme exporter protein CcmB [Spongorhabdus nitratireducens]
MTTSSATTHSTITQSHSVSSGQAFMTLLRRDMLLAIRNKGDWVNPLFFYLLIVMLFPLAITPQKDSLIEMAGGAIWIAALLSVLLSMDSLFRSDFEDGSLEQLLLAPHPLSLMVISKLLAHWLLTGLLLTLFSPLLALLLHLPFEAGKALFAGLLVGTPILSILGAIGVALTVGLRRGGVLLSLLVMPLYIPILIFGSGAVLAALDGLSWAGHIYWLGSLLMLALTLGPFAIAGALRISLE